MRFVLPLAALALSTVAIPVTVSAADAPAASASAVLGPILADPRRNEDRERDVWRHPAEVLDFFQVKPGMTVVDFMPSGGWWTRILVPYLGESGQYIGLNPDISGMSPQMQQYFGKLAETLPGRAEEWTGVPAQKVWAYNSDGLPDTLNGTVDRVLIFREVHNMMRMGMTYRELTAMRRLLKPGGMLGIVQHRARPDASADYTDGNKGYLREKDVIGLIEAHGFEFVGKSEVNANPKDPANHPEGVWELPPNLRTKREELKAIGESDRMTLLFRKRG